GWNSFLLLVCGGGGGPVGALAGSVRLRRTARRAGGAQVERAGGAALGVDEVLQPLDLPLDLLEAVPGELRGVGVHPCAGALGGLPEHGEPLDHPGVTALEDAQPGARVRRPEEREADVEGLVVPRRRLRGGEGRGEPLPPGRGEPVDDPRPSAGEGVREGVRARLGDEPGLGEPAQGWVERAVGQRPEGAELGAELTAQLVAVHGRGAELTEDGQLEDLRTGCHGTHSSPDGSTRCIGAIYRTERSAWRPNVRPGRRPEPSLRARSGAPTPPGNIRWTPPNESHPFGPRPRPYHATPGPAPPGP